MSNKRRIVWGMVCAALACLAAIYVLPLQAAPEPNMTAVIQAHPPIMEMIQPETAVLPHAQIADDTACRLCHQDTDAVVEFPSGETLPAHVDLAVLTNSAHGPAATDDPLTCSGCHQPTNDYQLPHAPVTADTLREYELMQSANCETCHVQPHVTSHPGPESENPVACTDCHGAHDVLTVEQWQAGQGTETCVDCHFAEEVPLVEESTLTEIIRDGLFTPQVDNSYCLSCHSQEGLTYIFPSGDVLDLTIDAEALHDSVHGEANTWQPLACTDCHENIETFPHEPVQAASLREYNLQQYPLCGRCHEPKYDQTLDDVHGMAIAEGEEDAAVCTDCHGAHDTPIPDEPRERISYTCAQCHSTIFEEYAESIHGEALLSESNPDVPTCINCHEVHNITDPTTALFRIRSPQLCAECHADVELMEKYDISTDVFDTYVADFHGTTVTLFEHQDPNVETNKAVCYDCHGVHNIKDPDDPQAGIKANLLETCQQCHPDATTNFPDSWTSHFKPSLENNPLVFLVNLFYQIVIPATLGFFSFMVATDVYRRVRLRLRR
ncbi:MAG: cytochrome c3 family protein [Anaerolineaceae bacterium]|nr:cytochrome c3 family protein [Anaerolineaceae bacterium]